MGSTCWPYRRIGFLVIEIKNYVGEWEECPSANSPVWPTRTQVLIKSIRRGYTATKRRALDCWRKYVILDRVSVTNATEPSMQKARADKAVKTWPLTSRRAFPDLISLNGSTCATPATSDDHRVGYLGRYVERIDMSHGPYDSPGQP